MDQEPIVTEMPGNASYYKCNDCRAEGECRGRVVRCFSCEGRSLSYFSATELYERTRKKYHKGQDDLPRYIQVTHRGNIKR